MIPLTLEQIATITGGRLDAIDAETAATTTVTGSVEFDSRKLQQGSLFVALPGARVDGHDFADAAIQAGAVAVLAARPVGQPAIVVPEVERPDSNAEAFEHDETGATAAVLNAMSKLARAVIDGVTAHGTTVVGVTGSAGKTSTKDFMASIFRTAGETVAPPGSFNNEIGHPYTALRCTRSTKYLVAEMSARGIGHIAHLANIAPPRIGVVLNVGTAHLGEFGTRATIAQAKGELIAALPDNGVAVLNADDDAVAAMQKRTSARTVFFSERNTEVEYYATDISLDELARARFTLHAPGGNQGQVQLGVYGAHQVSNALAAAAAALEAGLPFADVIAALNSHTAASANRMDVTTRADGVIVINDSYNANPESMRAGIRALATTAAATGATTWAVLGQMGELGDSSVAEHEAIAAYLAEQGISHLVAVGTGVHSHAMATAAADAGINTLVADSVDAAINMVDSGLSGSDVVLVKASYAEALWRVAEGLLTQ